MEKVQPADSEKELFWASRGAEKGSVDCCFYLADRIYGNLLHPMYNQAQAIEVLRKIVVLGDREAFQNAVRKMGYIYGGPYMFNGPETPVSDRRKAAYCFTMAYIMSTDDNSDADLLRKNGYKVSEQEFNKLRDDAINRRLSF